MSKYNPLFPGQKFGRLTVVSLHHIYKYISPKGEKWNKYYYLCKCDCGKEVVIEKSSLKTKRGPKSCGCLRLEKALDANIIHGKTYTPLYYIWTAMKARCYNKNNKSYKNYGGRGISMCEKWKNDFMSFYDWSISNGYKEKLSIDRINNNGNYDPYNCRWATRKEQQRNTRKNHIIEYNGEKHCISEWAEKFGININTLRVYLWKGMTIKEVIERRKNL